MEPRGLSAASRLAAARSRGRGEVWIATVVAGIGRRALLRRQQWVVRIIVIRNADARAEVVAMHEVNWCENCGAIISGVHFPKPEPDGTIKLATVLICDCRGRPRPADIDRR